MAVQHKRRLEAGPPSSLLPGQLAVGDVDEAIYYGRTSGAVVTIQSGGGGGGGGTATVTLENRDTVTIYAGQAVQRHGSGVGLMRWDGARPCIGLMAAAVAPGFPGPVQSSGPLTLSDWSAATGSVTLPIAYVYGDLAYPGMLTSTVPASGSLQLVGQPVSPNTLNIVLPTPILL